MIAAGEAFGRQAKGRGELCCHNAADLLALVGIL